jgi:hypothetical protein
MTMPGRVQRLARRRKVRSRFQDGNDALAADGDGAFVEHSLFRIHGHHSAAANQEVDLPLRLEKAQRNEWQYPHRIHPFQR